MTLKLLSGYFDLLVGAVAFCYRLGLVTDIHAAGCGGFVETLNQFC